MSLPLIKQIMSSGQLTIQGVLLLPPGLPHVPCFNLTKTMSHPVQGFSSLNSGWGLRSQYEGVGLGLSQVYGGSLFTLVMGKHLVLARKAVPFLYGEEMLL